MKIRSALIAAIALIAVWPTIANAQHRGGGGGHGGGGGFHGGGGGGGRAFGGGGGFGGGRAAVHFGSRGSMGAPRAFRGAPGGFNRSAMTVRSRSGARANPRAVQRARLRNAPATRAASVDRARRFNNATSRRAQVAQVRAARAAAQPRRFAARFNGNRWRFYHGPSWWAWHHGWHADWVGWYGGLFWPFVYADIFNWTFWPWGYDPGYWYYAYDDFFDGVFYGYGSASPPPVRYARRGSPPAETANYAQAQAQDLCKQPGTGVTAWPIADIEQAVQPNDEQRKLLDKLKDVSQQAAQTFAVVCPAENDLAGTAPGRLATIIGRLQATEEVITTVKPALDEFYNSLTDEQKARFDALGPKETASASRRPRNTVGQANQQADRCGNVNTGLADLPMRQIQMQVKPSEEQQDAFRQLQEATDKAIEHLKANCPQDTAPATPSARLDAMQANIRVMIEAAETIRPALENFYGALDDTQKTRLNKLDKKMASAE